MKKWSTILIAILLIMRLFQKFNFEKHQNNHLHNEQNKQKMLVDRDQFITNTDKQIAGPTINHTIQINNDRMNFNLPLQDNLNSRDALSFHDGKMNDDITTSKTYMKLQNPTKKQTKMRNTAVLQTKKLILSGANDCGGF